jgi:hypothetical protein
MLTTGRGLRNLYQFKELQNLTVATDNKITSAITISNPHDKPLHVKEIFTTVRVWVCFAFVVVL